MVEAEINESVKPALRRFIKLLTLLIVALIALVGLVGAYMYKDQLALPDWFPVLGKQVAEEGVEGQAFTFNGEIYFTLAPVVGGGSTDVHTYSQDTADKSADLVRQAFSGTQMSFSSDGKWVTFLAPSVYLSKEEQRALDDSVVTQVFRARLDDYTSLEDAVTNAEQLTDLQAAWKSLPVINDKGEVLFISRGVNTAAEHTSFSLEPNNWTIHYVNSDGVLSSLANGAYPQWYDNDHLLYMDRDGIYYSSLSTDDKQRIYFLSSSSWGEAAERIEGIKYEDVGGTSEGKELPHSLYTIFNLSDDGSILVVSSSIWGHIDVLRVVKETDGVITMKLVHALDGIRAFWPQVSPDNEYVGLTEFDPLRYSVYKTDTMESVMTPIDMQNFDAENVRVTDWH